jgi:hypothetical protein
MSRSTRLRVRYRKRAKRARVVFVDFMRDGGANSMPTQPGADRPVAVGLVSPKAFRPTSGLTARGPFDGGLHQGFIDDTFMVLSSGRDEGHGNRRLHLTMAVGEDMDFALSRRLEKRLLANRRPGVA